MAYAENSLRLALPVKWRGPFIQRPLISLPRLHRLADHADIRLVNLGRCFKLRDTDTLLVSPDIRQWAATGPDVISLIPDVQDCSVDSEVSQSFETARGSHPYPS